MDIVRELLLKLEAIPSQDGAIHMLMPGNNSVSVDGYDPSEIFYHLRLLHCAGFIEGRGANPQGGISFRSLTWQGHEYLDLVRDSKIWEKTKKGAETAGGFTIDLLVDLAKGFVRTKIEEHTGVKL